jgi:hypothetical protein
VDGRAGQVVSRFPSIAQDGEYQGAFHQEEDDRRDAEQDTEELIDRHRPRRGDGGHHVGLTGHHETGCDQQDPDDRRKE